MKRNPNVLRAGLLLSAGLWAGSVWGQTSLSVGTVPAYPGTTVTVPMSLRQGSSAVAAQFDVAFNSSKVSALEPALGFRLTNHVLRSRQVAPGVRRVLIYSLANSAMAGTNLSPASLPFTVAPNEFVGSGPISPTNVVLARADGQAMTQPTLFSGAIFTRPVNYLPNGTAQFFLPSEPDRSYLIQASSDLKSWVDLVQTNAVSSFLNLIDADAALYPQRFYRPVPLDVAAGQLSALVREGDSSVHFRLAGLRGRAYVVQASTNLQSWTDLTTNVVAAASVSITNAPTGTFPYRFFRLKSGP